VYKWLANNLEINVKFLNGTAMLHRSRRNHKERVYKVEGLPLNFLILTAYMLIFLS